MESNFSSPSPPTRIRTRRWTAKLASLFTSSRAISSGVFIVLIVVTDHLVVAADGYMNANIQNAYDPLVIASCEGLLMVGLVLVLYGVLSRRGFFSHKEWIRTVRWRELAMLGLLSGIEAVLWALASKDLSQQYYEALTVVSVPLVFLVRYGLFEAYHLFHLAGGLYTSLGLLSLAFSSKGLDALVRSDYYFLGQVVVWSLLMLSVSSFFGHTANIPVVGVVAVVLVARFCCAAVTMVTLLGVGKVNASTFGCLLIGHGCAAAVPATLIAHACVTCLRLCSYFVVVKYVGAPLCVITNTASTALRFYTHDALGSLEVGAAFVSVAGCAVFVHAQWMLEASHNEEWDEHLRCSNASTSLVDDSDDSDVEDPIVMEPGGSLQ